MRWGQVATRFAGSRWTRPGLDLAAIVDDAVAAWFRARLRPKVLVASQTRVVEAVVDPSGILVPSVPVITVEPHDPSDVWRMAAVLCAPSVSARLASSGAGTGLSERSIRVRAADLAEVPLPIDAGAWREGADLAELAQTSADASEWGPYRSHLEQLAEVMNAAYEATDDGLAAWWIERVRFPSASPAGIL